MGAEGPKLEPLNIPASAAQLHATPLNASTHLIKNSLGVSNSPALKVASAQVAPAGTATNSLTSFPALSDSGPSRSVYGGGWPVTAPVTPVPPPPPESPSVQPLA
jgi:hypothetical protein